MIRDKAIQGYLERYAEPESASETLTNIPKNQHCLIVPAYQETVEQVESIWQHLDSSHFVVILVINSPTADNASEVNLYRSLTASEPGPELTFRTPGPDLIVVDRFTKGRTIPEKQGVGLARKIGSDIALRLYSLGKLESPWLNTTDADAVLPENYFQRATTEDHVAEVMPFVHEGGNTTGFLFYEINMLYYAAGLQWAGSPYGFTTIGSTLSVRCDAYARVRGYPKRSTGEDFHLLSKLRKIGPVAMNERDPIQLQARHSDRVPVGTGPALQKIAEMEDPIGSYNYYHPDCFSDLRDFLRFLSALADGNQTAQTDNPRVQEFIDQIGLMERYTRKAEQNPSTKVMSKFLNDWFDGLRTLQFIHYMRDNHHGSLPLAQLPDNPITGRFQGSLEKTREELATKVFA